MRAQLRLILLFLFVSSFSIAQEIQSPKSTLLFYGDVYYSLPVNGTGMNNELRLVNHVDTRQVAINSVIGNYTIETGKMRANAGLIVGGYASRNYFSEPIGFRNVYQANIGLRISQKYNMWLDAGVMPSHIGLESVITTDNPTLYRSLAAEYSPYYEAGLKLSAQKGNHFAALFLLNGWQRIKLTTPYAPPALGGQYTYANSKFSFNWSSFLGNLENRSYYDFLFNSFYATLATEEWKLYLGLDVGFGELQDSSSTEGLYTMYGIVQRTLNKKSNAAVRIEYYNDPSRIIATPLVRESLNCLGTSLTYSYTVLAGCLLRAEYRFLYNETDVFLKNDLKGFSNELTNSRHTFNLSLSYKLNKVLP